MCDILARLDSKQSCLSLLYPGVSLFGDAPRKYSEASVQRARDSSLARWTTRGVARSSLCPQGRSACATSGGQDNVDAAATHAAASPASPWDPHQHRKLSVHTAPLRAAHLPGEQYHFMPSPRQNLGTTTCLPSIGSTHRAASITLHWSLLHSWSVLCSEPATARRLA